jgi:hypothetical protein
VRTPPHPSAHPQSSLPSSAAALPPKSVLLRQTCNLGRVHDASLQHVTVLTSRSLLERAVAIDSGTGDADGRAAVDALFAADLEALGATVRRVPSTPPAVGDNILATLTGTGV